MSPVGGGQGMWTKDLIVYYSLFILLLYLWFDINPLLIIFVLFLGIILLDCLHTDYGYDDDDDDDDDCYYDAGDDTGDDE